MEKLKPKRVIIYWLDGISAMFVKSFNQLTNMPETYLDELYKQSYVKKYCYGFDCTIVSLYAIMSGQTFIETPISRVTNAKQLNIKNWITDKIKEKGYKTHYYINYKSNFERIPLKFDKIVHKKRCYNLCEAEQNDDFWGKNTEDKTMVFIHDEFTHDREGKQFNYTMTTNQYTDLIKRNCELLRKNLKFLEFNKKEDLLIVMSDHGLTLDSKVVPEKMTIPAHLKVMFKKERLGNWDIAGKEIKSRVMFMMHGCGIKHYVDEEICTIQKAFDYFLKQFGINNYLSDSAKYYNEGNEAITANCGMFPINPIYLLQKVIFNDRFYQFVYVRGSGISREKYIYQKNLGKIVWYDLLQDPYEKKPINIKYNDLPYSLKKFMKEYNKTRKRDIKYIMQKIKKGVLIPL